MAVCCSICARRSANQQKKGQKNPSTSPHQFWRSDLMLNIILFVFGLMRQQCFPALLYSVDLQLAFHLFCKHAYTDILAWPVDFSTSLFHKRRTNFVLNHLLMLKRMYTIVTFYGTLLCWEMHHPASWYSTPPDYLGKQSLQVQLPFVKFKKLDNLLLMRKETSLKTGDTHIDSRFCPDTFLPSAMPLCYLESKKAGTCFSTFLIFFFFIKCATAKDCMLQLHGIVHYNVQFAEGLRSAL